MVALAVAAGAVTQTMVGLGLGLVAAPVITLVAPESMPAVMLWLAIALPVVTLASERHEIDWAGIGWTTPTRIVGTAVGAAAVAALPVRSLGLVVAVVVLAAVIATWRAVRIPVTRPALVVAGLVSGFSGTATAIGGPPMAILYQHRPARQIRTTLAVYFLLGASLSLLALGVAGELRRHDAVLAAGLLPLLLLGSITGSWLRPRLAEHHVRPAVLLVCASSAIVLGVRSILG